MRGLRRPRVKVPTLSAGGKGAKAAEELRLAKQKKPNQGLEFPDHWNEGDVRGALYAMQGWVCAYCNCKLLHADRGDVEHFRPKGCGKGDKHSGYFWLAYDFENYFLACGICNTSYKGTRFPLEPGGIHIEFEQRGQLETERRLLVNPALDPLEEWLRVDCMDDLTPVRARPGLTGLALDRSEASIDLFQLNLRIELIQERARAVAEAGKLSSQEEFQQLRRCASRYRTHGMTYRDYLQTYEPQISLPDPEEELEWFLEDILRDRIEVDRKLRALGSAPRQEEGMMEELRWLLAVLWKDPPAHTAAWMETWLEEHRLLDEVQRVYEKLR